MTHECEQPMRYGRHVLAATAMTAMVASISLTATAPPAEAAPRVDTEHVSLSPATSSKKVTVDQKAYTVVAEMGQTATRPFDLVGFTWSSQTGKVAVQYRVLHGSTWSAWDVLEVDSSERGRPGTDPVYTEQASGVEARVITTDGGSVTDAKATLIDPQQVPSDAAPAQVTTQAVSGYTPRPAVITRAAWGADESLLSTNGADCVPPDYDTTTKAVIVHHTAGSNSYTKDQSASIVRGIYRFHVLDRGWCDIGYNALVDKYGQIFEGRHGGLEYPVHGAHATLWNTDTFGVSVMMDSNTAAVTAATKSSLTRIIAWKLANNYRPAQGQVTLAGKQINIISGHGDVMQTECPGTNLRAYLPTLRTQVAAALSTTTRLQSRWQQLGGESGSLGPVFVLERDLMGGRVVDFKGGTLFLTSGGQILQLNAPMAARARAAGYAALGWMQGNPVARSGGLVATFPNGEVHWTSSTAAALVTPPVLTWLNGHPTLKTQLGLAVGDQTRTSSGALVQQFQNGALLQKSDGSFQLVTARFPDKLGDVIAVDTAQNKLWWIPGQADVSGGKPLEIGRGWATTTWISQMGDINGDGLTELVARRDDGSLWLYRSVPTGGYAAGEKIGRGWGSIRLMVIVNDLNGDRLPELMAVDARQNLIRYSFNPKGGYLTGASVVGKNWDNMQMLTTVDQFIGDPTPDLLAVDKYGRLFAYALNSGGNTTESKQVGHGWGGMNQMWSTGDLNGDGRRDLLGRSSGTGQILGYLNAGNQSWQGTGVWYAQGSGYRLLA
ncbi:FG-GAP-like repeat-containing protein [Aestuariimicrobium sp. T2.26MG-19.2B]|uniref:FG-GAP-like repeat-containing protein n=1 Tax=Aestuariimicrobium sp. T2.26MG-19.2B TaxID=3040679 RepID=UPI002541E43D|nr:FG-GAP-like repeat-containing protein [Aestuariimicrobium sp. T2.26MG-19.2B]